MERARSRRALVVDDSLSARRAMAQVLSDSGFEVSTARDGMEAVEELEKTRPDILFVDLEMPRMNGIELTSHVRSRADTAHVPIVMITSRSTEKHRAQARTAGVNAYLTKPFDADDLLEQAERLMEAP
jgi:chemosensory pili system protein ChpA (sensor histidine kinase/response regulator)